MTYIKSIHMEPKSGGKRSGNRSPRIVYVYADGERKFKTLKGYNAKEAKEFLRGELQKVGRKVSNAFDGVTFQAYANHYATVRMKEVEAGELSVNEHKNIVQSLRIFHSTIGPIYLKDLDKAVATDFINTLKRSQTRYGTPYKVVTINSYLRRLSAAFEQLRLDNGIEENPFSRLLLTESKKIAERAHPFKDGEIYKLDLLLQTKPPWLYFAFIFALQTGVRCAEVLDANLNRMETDAIHITGKGNKERLVPLSDIALNAIEERRKAMHDPALSAALIRASVNGRSTERNYERLRAGYLVFECMRPDSLTKAFGACVRELGMRGSMHRLRHTFGRVYLDNGGDLNTLSRILGHESIAITHEIYGHVSAFNKMRDINSRTYTPPDVKRFKIG